MSNAYALSRTPARTVAALLLLTLATGCRVNKSPEEKHGDVSIATPFGGLSVKTHDDAAIQQGVGLAIYPGAVPVTKTEDGKPDKNEAADVNLSFGSFHLGVKALSYQTADAPEKVLAFYRKDMARYGDVIQCHDHEPVGTPSRTAQGLTCENDNNNHIKIDASETQQELKAGSKTRQHIVSVKVQDGGSRIELVALELPDHLNIGGGDKDPDSKQ
jgi:hypothetical protein